MLKIEKPVEKEGLISLQKRDFFGKLSPKEGGYPQ